MDNKLIFRKPELIGIRKLKKNFFFPLQGLEMLTSNIYVHFRRACACAERTLCAIAVPRPTLPRGIQLLTGTRNRTNQNHVNRGDSNKF